MSLTSTTYDKHLIMFHFLNKEWQDIQNNITTLEILYIIYAFCYRVRNAHLCLFGTKEWEADLIKSGLYDLDLICTRYIHCVQEQNNVHEVLDYHYATQDMHAMAFRLANLQEIFCVDKALLKQINSSKNVGSQSDSTYNAACVCATMETIRTLKSASRAHRPDFLRFVSAAAGQLAILAPCH